MSFLQRDSRSSNLDLSVNERKAEFLVPRGMEMGSPEPLTFLCPLPALAWKYCHPGLWGAWSENHSSGAVGILLLLK